MIQPIGRKPYAAPYRAVAAAAGAGMPKPSVATPSATTSATNTAMCARHCRMPRVTSRRTIGSAATAVLSHGLPRGS
jgi:hypothetical protein